MSNISRLKSQLSGAAKGAAAPKSQSKPAAGKQGLDMENMHETMFKSLDKDKDGLLSREEMQKVIEATNKNAANQQAGESGDDFFKTLDRNGDGTVDKDEATAFFKAAFSQMGGAGGKEEL